jgi:zinc transport system ATP-binding protein
MRLVDMSALVELREVSLQREGEVILDRIDLRVEQGDFLGIIGPNGAGKTTLLRIILGLQPLSSGTVILFGQPVETFRDWARLGYIPQRVALDPRFPATVAEVVASGLTGRTGLFRSPGPDASRAVEEALQLVGMAHHRQRLVGRLSVGQQQRALIARALVTRPELLLLDEPTGGIDPEAQEQFYELLQTLNRSHAVTLILVTHDIAVVGSAVRKLACLNRRLVFHGEPKEFLSDAALSSLYGAPVHLLSHRH